MGQADFRKIDALALPTEIEQREQPLEEHRAFFDGGGTIVKNLRQKGIDTQKGPKVALEQKQRFGSFLSV